MTAQGQDQASGTEYRPQTAAAAFERVLQGENARVAIGDLLDDWRRTPLGDRLALVDEPVASTGDRDLLRWAAYLAAAVEQLCALDGLGPPSWVGREVYRLREPWFLVSGLALRAWLLVSTPVPFKRRNIFTGDRALDRA